MFHDKKIILASLSPRRKQLLEQAEVEFVIKVKPIEEIFPQGLSVEKIPPYIARNKALAVKGECGDEEIIIAADTLVVLRKEIIGKPEDKADAIRILSALSGRMHRVITGVCIMKGERETSFADITEVYFRKLTGEQIVYYIDHYKPYDKAGAYAIQEWIGLVGIEKINGCYFNVMGLPVGRVIEAIKRY